MTVRCSTSSVGVSCPEAEGQAGHRATQHMRHLNPFSVATLLSSVHKRHTGSVRLQKTRSLKRVLGDLMWKSLQLRTFWYFLDRNIWLRLHWKAAFYTHKLEETLTITRCALFLTDYLTCIKKATVTSKDSSCGESLYMCFNSAVYTALQGGNVPPFFPRIVVQYEKVLRRSRVWGVACRFHL